jgi:hypothetical protein
MEYSSESMAAEVREMIKVVGLGFNALHAKAATPEELKTGSRGVVFTAGVVFADHFLIGVEQEEDMDDVFVVMLRERKTDTWTQATVKPDSLDEDIETLNFAFAHAVKEWVLFTLKGTGRR